jgi:cytoskeletal protein CcmA (bactofilin family)
MAGLLFTVLLGFVGLVIDVGNLARLKGDMQHAVDAAVLAGGQHLPDESQALATARRFLQQNDMCPEEASINFATLSAVNPQNYPQINCSLTRTVPTLFMGLFGHEQVELTVQASAIALPQGPGGPFDYAVFSGSTSYTLDLNGSFDIRGSVHSNYRLTITGSSIIRGRVEGLDRVRITGANIIDTVMADSLSNIRITGANQIGSQQAGATVINMPDFSQQIAATAAQTYNSSQTFNGAVDLSGNIYVRGNVTFNGSGHHTGVILADGNITLNGSSSFQANSQVCLYSAQGNITINGATFVGSNSSAIIYAPNGRITVNGASSFRGRIIGKEVNFNGSSVIDADSYPVTSLSGRRLVKLVK